LLITNIIVLVIALFVIADIIIVIVTAFTSTLPLGGAA
jgi:hypothetical protein